MDAGAKGMANAMPTMAVIRRGRRCSSQSAAAIITRKDLEAAHMGVFPVLVVLDHAHLDDHRLEHVARIGIQVAVLIFIIKVVAVLDLVRRCLPHIILITVVSM